MGWWMTTSRKLNCQSCNRDDGFQFQFLVCIFGSRKLVSIIFFLCLLHLSILSVFN